MFGFDLCNPTCLAVNMDPLGKSVRKRDILTESSVDAIVEYVPPLNGQSALFLAIPARYSPAGESSGNPGCI